MTGARLKYRLPAERPLTPREREVLGLIGQALTPKEIAVRLDLATKTVQVHIYNAMGKLQLHSRAEVVRWAIRHELSPRPSERRAGDRRRSDRRRGERRHE